MQGKNRHKDFVKELSWALVNTGRREIMGNGIGRRISLRGSASESVPAVTPQQNPQVPNAEKAGGYVTSIDALCCLKVTY